MVAGVVLAKENHVVVFFKGICLVEPRFRRDIYFAADDGVNTLLFAGTVKINHAVPLRFAALAISLIRHAPSRRLYSV